MPFFVQLREPMIAIIGLFNKSVFPSKYKVCGGLGMLFNCLGYSLSVI